jgi:protein AbiQ
MKIKFYEVDENYLNYLKHFDRQIPDMNYSRFNKFVCGVVLTIGNLDYFAPISSFNKKQSTNFVIKDKGRDISSIRFCFMFPAPDEMIKLKDFLTVPQHYRDLLNAEVNFCNKNVDEIHKIAKRVYKIGTNPNHPLSHTCCDFKLLEEKCLEFIQQMKVNHNEEVAIAERDTRKD